MEDIIKKNIFQSKNLEKLSPDYNPSNVLLRIQTRRQIVKDTHIHRSFKNNPSQRKTFKRPKFSHHAMNREISKMRNGFQSMNLKNQIMLKNAFKKLDSLKLKDLPVEDDDESKDFIRSLLNEFTTVATELALCSENDFKIKDKPNTIKLSHKVRNGKKKIKEPLEKVFEPEEDINENILRIECKHIKYQEFVIDSENEVKNEDETLFNDNHNIRGAKNEENCYHTSPRNNFDNQLNDLQTLLIMMAISPKPNESDSLDSPIRNRQVMGGENTVVTSPRNCKVTLDAVSDKDIQIEKFFNVTPIRVDINDREKHILKKYVEKWKICVSKKKDYQRQNALNNFFDKLTKKKLSLLTQSPEPIDKAKLIASDFNRYQHRYKMQKHIIALQKAKLEEQRRIIDELKYNKIIEASKQSVGELKEAVRKTYYEIDRQLKPRVKCLTNELKIPDVEVLHCLKVPQFLQRMEKRAREREEKHAVIRERRRQMEEERLRLKQQEELAKAAMDKEEKIKRMKELKDKRKKEKVEGIRKKQHTDRMRALRIMAEIHYEKNLMAKYGIRPLRILIELKRNNIEKANSHYKFQLKKNIFLNWMWYTEDMWYERNFKAVDFRKKKLLRKSFEALIKNLRGYMLKKQVAEDYYDLYVTQLVFRKFREVIHIIQTENELRCQKATLYFQSNLLFKTFTCWRTLPALNMLKKEQEARKARWREKVLQVVPDYTPPDD